MKNSERQKRYIERNNIVKIGIDERKEIRDEFKRLCKLNNVRYTKVLRTFVYKYINEHQDEETKSNICEILYEKNKDIKGGID